jgi:hypothetical protein
VCLLRGTFCPHSVFVCVVWIWDQTAIISLYNINWLVFITETKCVYCAVRCAHRVFMSFVWIWEQTAIISLYNINWLVFITETECVYCAVRTKSLNKTRYFSSLKGMKYFIGNFCSPNSDRPLTSHTFCNATVPPNSWHIREVFCSYICEVRIPKLGMFSVRISVKYISHMYACLFLYIRESCNSQTKQPNAENVRSHSVSPHCPSVILFDYISTRLYGVTHLKL